MTTLQENPKCFSCSAQLPFAPGTNVGRSQECPNCDADLRVCLNCRHYDPDSYNECGEPMAERVVDKDKRNFCDYFALEGTGGTAGAEAKTDARKKLDDLFKK